MTFVFGPDGNLESTWIKNPVIDQVVGYVESGKNSNVIIVNAPQEQKEKEKEV